MQNATFLDEFNIFFRNLWQILQSVVVLFKIRFFLFIALWLHEEEPSAYTETENAGQTDGDSDSSFEHARIALPNARMSGGHRVSEEVI
jgi:hypothetical protein